MLYTTHYDSPIGRLLLAERDEALIGLWIEGQKYFPDLLKEETSENKDAKALSRARGWLDRYFR